MSDPYRSIEGRERLETEKVKGSRFIATAIPLENEADLAPLLAELKREFPDANHHCWAWRNGEAFRYSDDGEPSGSAGRPILQQLDGAGLDRVGCVVTRIFGGTKLGVGGLMRAYGGAAKELLAAARILTVVPKRLVSVVLPYELDGALLALAKGFELSPDGSTYGADVRHQFRVPVAEVERFVDELTERSAGRAQIELGTMPG